MKCKGQQFQELEPLDLKKTETVSDIVHAMSKCSFGARNLGDTTSKIEHIINHNYTRNQECGTILYDGDPKDELSSLLREFSGKWNFSLLDAEEFSHTTTRPKNLIAIGRFSPRHDEKIFAGGEFNTIFINSEGYVRPGQVQDGYFPNVVFSDPRYIIPIIDAAIDERFTGKKTTVTQLFQSMPQYKGVAKLVPKGAENFLRMVRDPKYKVFFTMSGAMTVAQMSYVLCDMIDDKMIQSLTTTGAAMAHSLVPSMGLKHYKHDPAIPDSVLTKELINRVTDTLEPETNFDHIDEILHAVLSDISQKQAISPSEFHAKIGKYLSEKFPNERGILKSAYEKGVPVFVPAFYDSELGNDVTTHNKLQRMYHKRKVQFDLEPDNWKLINHACAAERIGIFTVGGGVPRNWTQNLACLIEILNGRTDLGLREMQFSSGVRISPDEMYFGHLSGCTYSEGMTWRKMDPKGSFVEIKADATQVWPFIIKYVMEHR